MITNENYKQILGNLDYVRHLMHVWPPQNQPNVIGSKVQLIRNLDMIAAEVTKSARPQTRVITKDICPIFPDNIVIKQTHSDAGLHVLLPGDPNHTWDYIYSNSEVPGCQWFGQSYVDTLY